MAQSDSALTWRKSSLSFSNGNCVEIVWQKASSNINDGHCLELGELEGLVLVRNSRFPDQVLPGFTADEWRAFLAGVHNGEFDHFGATR
jgi:hypothetical protein